MRASAVGDVLDQRRAEIGAGAFGSPFRHGVHGQIVVAVDAKCGNAEAEAAGGEGAGAAAGNALEGRDRPLVVDDVEDDGRLVGGGEDQRRMEIAFGGRAVADPAGGDLRVAADRRSHRPADRLDVLRGEVAGDREEAVFLRGIHDRQLPSLQRVGLVGIDLVHHRDHRVAVGDEQAGLPIGREVHVARLKRLAEGGGDGFFAEMLHVEGGLALPLRHLHAGVEGAQRHHVAQAFEQFVVGQQPGPRADRLAGTVQHADDGKGEVADVARIDVDRRARHRARLGNGNVGEIRRAAGAHFRLRNVETQSVRHDRPPPVGAIFAHLGRQGSGNRLPPAGASVSAECDRKQT